MEPLHDQLTIREANITRNKVFDGVFPSISLSNNLL